MSLRSDATASSGEHRPLACSLGRPAQGFHESFSDREAPYACASSHDVSGEPPETTGQRPVLPGEDGTAAWILEYFHGGFPCLQQIPIRVGIALFYNPDRIHRCGFHFVTLTGIQLHIGLGKNRISIPNPSADTLRQMQPRFEQAYQRVIAKHQRRLTDG